jgi:hypothetical protein
LAWGLQNFWQEDGISGRIHGAVRGIGKTNIYVDDKRERLEIWVDKKEAEGLPYRYNKRVSINLFVGGTKYRGGLRSTPKTSFVWISLDLRDKNDQRVSLAKVLAENGFAKNDRVALIVNGEDVHVERE